MTRSGPRNRFQIARATASDGGNLEVVLGSLLYWPVDQTWRDICIPPPLFPLNWTRSLYYIKESHYFSNSSLELLVNYMRNAYQNAIAYFHSLDAVIQPLLVKASLTTNHIIDWTGQINPLHLQFNVPPERAEWVDTQTMMDSAISSLLCYFEHYD
jgi:hypothetical protein